MTDDELSDFLGTVEDSLSVAKDRGSPRAKIPMERDEFREMLERLDSHRDNLPESEGKWVLLVLRRLRRAAG